MENTSAESSVNLDRTVLVEMIDYFGYKCYPELMRDGIAQLEESGEELQNYPNLVNRLSFFGFKTLLKTLTVSDSANLKQVLKLFDELRVKWMDTADSIDTGVPSLQWLTIRYKIVLQLGLSLLRLRLGIPETEAFFRPDAMKLPTKFNFKQYEEDLDILMAECNVYGASNHVAAKAEKATAELVKKQLVDIRSKTTPSQLFNYSVFFLFNGNTLANFRRELTTFISDIEDLVLGTPTLWKKTVLAESTPTPNGSGKSWSLEKKNFDGPYVEKEKNSKRHRQEENEQEDQEAESSHKKSTGRPKKTKLPPVTEVYTQYDDSGNTALNSAEEVFFVNGDNHKRSKHRQRGPTAEETDAIVENLRLTRSKLKEKNDGKDPLDAVLSMDVAPIKSKAGYKKGVASSSISPLTETPPRAASGAPGSAKKSDSKKQSIISSRPSAETVTFDDTNEDDVESVSSDASDDNSSLNNTRARKTLAKMNKTKFAKTVAEAAGRSNEEEPKLKASRTPWSIEEEDALIAGIEKYGAGCWREMLTDPSIGYRFRDRTNVQLKDKYRNMVLKGYNF